jgi:hypothetical protein
MVQMGSRAFVVAGRLAVRLIPAACCSGHLAKAFDRQIVHLAVDAYDVLPAWAAGGAIVPGVEIGVAVLLTLGLFVRFAGIATAVLAGVFILGMGQAKARGLEIDCGCFGGGGAGEGVSWWDIARDVVFVLIPGIYLAFRPHGPWQLDNRFLDLEDEDAEHHDADEAPAPARAG